MANEIVDAFLGQIRQPELIGKEHAEKSLDNAAQRFARGHLPIALVDASLARSGTGAAQLADDAGEIPMPVVHRTIFDAVAAFDPLRLHSGLICRTRPRTASYSGNARPSREEL